MKRALEVNGRGRPKRKGPRVPVWPIAAFMLLTGCAPRAAVNIGAGADSPPPEAARDAAAEGRFGILEPEILLYDVSAGGVLEYREDWSGRASRQAAASAAVKLGAMGFPAALVPDAGGFSAELFRLKTKMRYHAVAFQSPFFGDANIISEIDSLTYSVGPLHALCDAYGVDGVLYIYGFAESLSEERRKAAPADGAGRAFMAAVMVNREGRVSWYRHLLVSGGLDMKAEAHSMLMVGAMLR